MYLNNPNSLTFFKIFLIDSDYFPYHLSKTAR